MNDNEMDFRVGDVVCDIRFGTGRIVDIDTGDDCWPVGVSFGEIRIRFYKFDGRYFDDDVYPSLYHGTWEQVFGNLPDLKPKRKVKRWVNLYSHDQGIIATPPYSSAENARKMAIANEAVAVAVEIEVDE